MNTNSFLLMLASILFISAATADSCAADKDGRTAWPAFYGQVGPYHLKTADEIGEVAKAGFHIVLINYPQPGTSIATALETRDVNYIDDYPGSQISAACTRDNAVEGKCSPSNEQVVLAEFDRHLAAIGNDRHLIGFWILDDYPGSDVRDLLGRIHAHVTQYNAEHHSRVATICGFGGDLDHISHEPGVPIADTSNSGFDLAVQNFDSNACDLVALYPYGSRGNTDLPIDWKMVRLLPYMLRTLTHKGWDGRREPLVGMPQTFGYGRYVIPTESDIVSQSEAYCAAGAISLISYTWEDSYVGTKSELFNSPWMVRALKNGTEQCKKRYWN